MTRAPLLLPALTLVGVLALLSFLGLGRAAAIERESRTLRVAGTVIGDVRRTDAGSTFVFAVDGGPRLRASLGGSVAPGERLVLRGRFVPFDEARNPGEPSARSIGLAEGLAGELRAGGVIARAPPDPWDARTWGARLRAAASARLRARVPEPQATVLAGALWGERGTLPHDLRDDFQATGTVHVLVTAGLHLGVVAAAIAFALRLFAAPRVPAAFVAIPCVVAYAWLSGAHLPSQRAAVMVSVALLARACGARVASWNALALAAIVVALMWPASVATVSFALSFSCVSAIVLFARPLEHALASAPLPGRIREALALTISTQIGVWPLSAATFGLVAPYAVLANAVVVPATGIAMLAGAATLALAAVPIAGDAAALIASWDVAAIVRVVEAVASLPGARVSVAPPPALAIVAYDLAAIVAATQLRARPRVAVAILAFASVAVLATTVRPPDGRLTITMLDVGQGDGIVIRTPGGHTILIDTGGRLERGGGSAGGESPAEVVGERIVLGYLRRTGVREVDLLIVTHPHGDHVGAFAPIVRALRVDAILDSGQQYGGRAFNDGMHEAAAHRVPVRVARCGDRWSSGDGVMLTVLSPCGELLSGGSDDVNENSVVTMLQYGTFRILFTGDAGFETEEHLLQRRTDLHADILKVGHHGSAYASSAAFIAAVSPHIALISVGRHNVFGHPASSTIAVLATVGSRVYRTDRCGAIVVTAPPPSVKTLMSCEPRAANAAPNRP